MKLPHSPHRYSLFLAAFAVITALSPLNCQAQQAERKQSNDSEEKSESKLVGKKAGEVREFAGIEFVWCPPTPEGGFAMGSAKTESGRDTDETLHQVSHTGGFWIARTECTQAQFRSLMGGNPSFFRGDDLPVENVDWAACMEWCRALDRKIGLSDDWKVNLPTEAQWEYACRAGSSTAFHFGNVLNGKQANCNGSLYPYGTKVKGPNRKGTSGVGSYEANSWGIYDMHGNVWEWCYDRYGKTYYQTSHFNPAGPVVGTYRIRRGGSWNSHPRYCRAANRFRGGPEQSRPFIGFRAVITPTEYEVPSTSVEMPTQPAGEILPAGSNKLFPSKGAKKN